MSYKRNKKISKEYLFFLVNNLQYFLWKSYIYGHNTVYSIGIIHNNNVQNNDILTIINPNKSIKVSDHCLAEMNDKQIIEKVTYWDKSWW